MCFLLWMEKSIPWASCSKTHPHQEHIQDTNILAYLQMAISAEHTQVCHGLASRLV